MNRLKKELISRGIIYHADELDIMRGAEHDIDEELVLITDQVIVTAWYSAVVDPRYHIYDRKTLKYIGGQDMNLDTNPHFFGKDKMNPWCVDVETNDWTEEDAEAADWAWNNEGNYPETESDWEFYHDSLVRY